MSEIIASTSARRFVDLMRPRSPGALDHVPILTAPCSSSSFASALRRSSDSRSSRPMLALFLRDRPLQRLESIGDRGRAAFLLREGCTGGQGHGEMAPTPSLMRANNYHQRTTLSSTSSRDRAGGGRRDGPRRRRMPLAPPQVLARGVGRGRRPWVASSSRPRPTRALPSASPRGPSPRFSASRAPDSRAQASRASSSSSFRVHTLVGEREGACSIVCECSAFWNATPMLVCKRYGVVLRSASLSISVAGA